MSLTVAALLRRGITELAAAGTDGAPGDARRLLAHALGIGADRLTLILPDSVPPEAAARFAEYVRDRAARRPVSRIIGRRHFYGRDFRITDAVLDPRPETETLVALALEQSFERVLDLGTGSGCILLTILAERAAARGIGTDLSPAALKVAAANAAEIGLDERVEWSQSDWWQGATGRFDLIVSNPPYIAAGEMEHLAPEVALHDPGLALSPGGDGLSAYRTIAEGARHHLIPGGRLLVEIGWQQGAAVTAIFRSAGLEQVRVHPDLDGKDRVVGAISYD